MAPVDPNVFNANVKPVAFFATEITLVLALLTAITRFFFVAHKALPPAGHTRNRQAIEHRHLPVFLTLGLLSLFVATFLKSSWRVASYREWIYDNNVVVPNTLWEAGYTKVLGDPALPLGLWWKDANIPTQYFYSILGSPGSFWGTSQLLAATVVWSIFVGIEARHRHIPAGYIVAFILLSQIVGLSTALNFFFAALLLTPVPLSKDIRTDKEDGSLKIPHPFVLLTPALLAFGWVTVLPSFLDFPIWPVICYVGYLAIPQLLVVLPQPNSLPWIQHADVRSARGSYRLIFQLLSLFSIVLYYLESGLVVLKTVETTPPKQTLKHNFLWNTHTKAEESLQQRAYSAIGTILGSLSEDAISSVTLWDLLLSGLSLCIWAYLQNVHVHSILRTIGLAWDDDPNFPYEPSVTDVSITPEEPSTPGPTIKKRRGRPRKNTTGITDAEQPTKTPVRSPRKLAAPTEVDGEYTPSPKTRGQVAELETLGVSSDVAEQNTGAGALAWVLFLVGGLGTAMSAILGGEVSGG